jgi:hypothetical protein
MICWSSSFKAWLANQRAAASVRRWPQSPSLMEGSAEAGASCSFPRPLLLHQPIALFHLLLIHSGSCLSFILVLFKRLHSTARLCAFSPFPLPLFHQYFDIHIQPTPCRGLSKISSSTTMRKRHVLSVLRSLISQIEAFGLASVVIRFVLLAFIHNAPPANRPFQICQFCYHNVRNNMNGLCPACRRPYDDANIEFRKPGPEEYPSLPTGSSRPSLTPITGKPSGEPNKPPSKKSSPPPPKRKLKSARPTLFLASI